MNSFGTGGSAAANAGARTSRKYALAPTKIGTTNGTTPSGTFLDGQAINRVDPVVALSGIPAIPAKITLGSGETCVIQRRIQHREDSSDTWADLGEDTPGDVTVTGQNAGGAILLDIADPGAAATPSTGGSIVGDRLDLDLSGAKQEVRLRIKATLSASGTDTCEVAGSLVLAGLGSAPAND